MADTPIRKGVTLSEDLFDKYTLPKIALVVILVASLVGAWVTTALLGRGITLTMARWVYLVSLGVLTGGLLWKHAFVRPTDLDTDAKAYCAAMYDRFDHIAAWALLGLGIGGLLVVRTYVVHLEWSSLGLGYGMLLGALIVVLTVTTRRSHAVEEQFRSPIGVTALGLALGTTAGTALLEVSLRGFTPFAAGVRVLHLLAFAVWSGGAVWNIFVAVPTGQKRPTVAVIRAAGAQLERFRWTVRIIIPTLVLTGLYQAVTALGTSGRVYLETPVGLAVLAKVGFIGALIVIFKLCPMWRACSPIDGVCDLDTQAPEGDRSDRTEVTNGD